MDGRSMTKHRHRITQPRACGSPLMPRSTSSSFASAALYCTVPCACTSRSTSATIAPVRQPIFAGMDRSWNASALQCGAGLLSDVCARRARQNDGGFERMMR